MVEYHAGIVVEYASKLRQAFQGVINIGKYYDQYISNIAQNLPKRLVIHHAIFRRQIDIAL